ncbi:hypothetical protein C0W80_18885 [Photobacterium leiognathi subsp. mandapamensis]|uniref:EAL domain-containing protein n=1 Tax=Photobacterium leiognathi TaxID=553611 RepID=UPI000D15D05F|nr:EAL domain-containing protein [Photobacterium leiognathi]PSU95239.1 hypothetical protein C0W80_18885 [Photobacterium leiognathi subsp. mandapamensis]
MSLITNIEDLYFDEERKENKILFVDLSNTINRMGRFCYIEKVKIIDDVSMAIHEEINDICLYKANFLPGIIIVIKEKYDFSIKNCLKTTLNKFNFKFKSKNLKLFNYTIKELSIKNNKIKFDCLINEFVELIDVQTMINNSDFELVAHKYKNLKEDDSRINFEVLLRLNREDMALSDFLKLTTKFSLRKKLDLSVIKKIFSILNHSKVELKKINSCSINISPLSICDINFSSKIIRMANENNIPLSIICFEILETSKIENLSNAIININELRKHGCRIAIDDFGTGNSNIDYLSKIPFDILKIDGYFIKNGNYKENEFFLNFISNLSSKNDFKIVAEFIDSNEALEYISNINIHYAQGYYISSTENLNEFLVNN